MQDKKFIEIETRRERYNKRKPIYQFELKDFVPIIGLKNYWNNEEKKRSILNLSSDYLTKCLKKEAMLSVYNCAVIGGTFSGLVELLSK